MQNKDKCALIIFAKQPVPGQVKTRLMPTYDATAAAEIHKKLVLLTLSQTVDVAAWQTQLWCAPDDQHAFFQYCVQHYDVTLQCQRGVDLGERMQFALTEVLRTYDYGVVIGTDCPLLGVSHIRQMFAALLNDDIAVIPSEDGGYAALGLKQVDHAVFANITWGQSTVWQQTQAKIADLHWRCKILPTLWDVDYPHDYRRARYLLDE